MGSEGRGVSIYKGHLGSSPGTALGLGLGPQQSQSQSRELLLPSAQQQVQSHPSHSIVMHFLTPF